MRRGTENQWFVAAPAVRVGVFDFTGFQQGAAVTQVINHDGIGLINMATGHHRCCLIEQACITYRIKGGEAVFHADFVIFLTMSGCGMY